MKQQTICLTLIVAFISLASLLVAAGGGAKIVFSPLPGLVTSDIQAGIESHIEEKTIQDGGFFKLPFAKKELRLKLVRVHTEYLANLAPGKHFACVDLVDAAGDVYDVDFFLAGDPGEMAVTETTVHKINGQPYYAWEQKKDKTWHKVPASGASQSLLGVVRGEDVFEFIYRATLPKITQAARLWAPFASSNQFQRVKLLSITAPGKKKILKERANGNRVLLLELLPEDGEKIMEIRYQVVRQEKKAYEEKGIDEKRYLAPENRVPVNENFREIATTVVKGKQTALIQARALYDHVIEKMRYIKFGEGWGQGDAVYACEAKTGNCTDFHSYFIALARAVNIPARFAIGAAIPSERNDGGVDGYHCWAEFYADEKWWPVDISEGDKYTALGTYYFGHHPANRFEFSRGRDLVVDPTPKSGPINFLAYPILEIGGKPAKVKTQFFFNRSDKL